MLTLCPHRLILSPTDVDFHKIYELINAAISTRKKTLCSHTINEQSYPHCQSWRIITHNESKSMISIGCHIPVAVTGSLLHTTVTHTHWSFFQRRHFHNQQHQSTEGWQCSWLGTTRCHRAAKTVHWDRCVDRLQSGFKGASGDSVLTWRQRAAIMMSRWVRSIVEALFTGWMPFLSLNQQCRITEAFNTGHLRGWCSTDTTSINNVADCRLTDSHWSCSMLQLCQLLARTVQKLGNISWATKILIYKDTSNFKSAD